MSDKMQRLCSAIHHAHMSHAKVARAIGMTPSNFGQKLKRDTFTDEELESISRAIGARFQPCLFVFPDGEEF